LLFLVTGGKIKTEQKRLSSKIDKGAMGDGTKSLRLAMESKNG